MATRVFPIVDPARLMDEMFGTLRQSPTTAAMPMDLYRTGDHYVLSVDLPGADPGTVDVGVEDRTLTIRAERTLPDGADLQWLARERPTGTYVRQLTLGRGVALDAVEASYRDGVLTLTIPVAEQAKPRKIEIQQHGSATAIAAGQEA